MKKRAIKYLMRDGRYRMEKAKKYRSDCAVKSAATDRFYLQDCDKKAIVEVQIWEDGHLAWMKHVRNGILSSTWRRRAA